MRQSKSERQMSAQVAQEVFMARHSGSVCPVHDAFAASDADDKDRYFSIARSLGYHVRKVDGIWYESEEPKSGADGE